MKSERLLGIAHVDPDENAQIVSVEMEYGMARWLYGLARAKVRKNEKQIARFAAKGDQSAEEAAEVLAKFKNDIEWQKTVLARLEAIERQTR